MTSAQLRRRGTAVAAAAAAAARMESILMNVGDYVPVCLRRYCSSLSTLGADPPRLPQCDTGCRALSTKVSDTSATRGSGGTLA